MSISKVLRCSRAYPLGYGDDIHLAKTPNGDELLFFVKFFSDYFDVLVIVQNSKYICRYKFPRFHWYLEDMYEYLTKELS